MRATILYLCEKYSHEQYALNLLYHNTELAWYNGYRKDKFPVSGPATTLAKESGTTGRKDYTEQDIINMFKGGT